MILKAADLFCGAGGTSSGLYHACRVLGASLDLVAINHWTVAVETHKANHPDARHICATLECVDPRDAVPGGHLDILVASPECTHHSNARGGRPVSDQLRASAWHILRWAEILSIDNILMENVREFRDWGPVDRKGKIIKSRKGETFSAFINALRSLNYTVEHKILNAADYGDPTSRKRLFIAARKGNRAIVWPEKTHTETNYRTARDIIDWDLRGESIFNRKKRLSNATMARIAAGLRKYGGENAKPFLVMLYGTNKTRSVDRPVPTITAGGNHIGVCEPFILQYHGNHPGDNDGERRTYGLNRPLPTLDTSNRYALVEPFVIHTNHKGGNRVHNINKPVPTITCAHRGEMALIEPFITILKGKSTTRDIDHPVPTITTNPHLYLCEPFITKYYGTGKATSVNKPLDTITTKDRFALVEPVANGRYVYDIRFRMLQPHELAAAMSFDPGYRFTGNKGDKVKQIGNAVPVMTAMALCREMLGRKAQRKAA